MKNKLIALLLAASFAFAPQAHATKLSAIADGGASVAATDKFVTVRSGTTDVLTALACASLSNGATGCSTATGTSGATIPLLNGANTWSGVQTYTNSDIALLGSSTGKTTFTSDNAGATNYTMHVPAANDTIVALAASQTLTNKTLTSPVLTTPALGTPASGVATNLTGLPLTTGVTGTLPAANGGTGATSLGTMFAVTGNVFNLTYAVNTLSGTTDAIPSSVAGGLVVLTNAAGDATTLPQANTAGYTTGFGFTIYNNSPEPSSTTPTVSTIGGLSSLELAGRQSCDVTSDGTNYLVTGCSSNSNVLRNSGVGWTNTGIGTSEVCLTNVFFPAMGKNDKLEIDTLWLTAGTASNSKHIIIKLATTACTPGSVTGVTGTNLTDVNMNSSSLVTARLTTAVWNANATNAQKAMNSASTGGNGTSSSTTLNTPSIETSAGGYLQFTSTTSTSSADTVTLSALTVRQVKNP